MASKGWEVAGWALGCSPCAGSRSISRFNARIRCSTNATRSLSSVAPVRRSFVSTYRVMVCKYWTSSDSKRTSASNCSRTTSINLTIAA